MENDLSEQLAERAIEEQELARTYRQFTENQNNTIGSKLKKSAIIGMGIFGAWLAGQAFLPEQTLLISCFAIGTGSMTLAWTFHHVMRLVPAAIKSEKAMQTHASLAHTSQTIAAHLDRDPYRQLN